MTDTLARLSTALADRYRLERELGQGGMATVYLAHDLRHDRQVAIKVLKPDLVAVLGAERFIAEIKTTAALQHPHILPLFDSGSADGFLFYVMPFVDGETLRHKLDREHQLGIDEAVGVAREVADALDYAHRHGVIHRDIKPENILLQDGRATVADFGIALAVSAAAGGRMTDSGLSLGTPHYMSPEQATAEREITGRSDIYSLGCVLYEMLTGNPPHVAATAQQIIMKIVTEEVAPVTALRKAVPEQVAEAIVQALEKLPADRFETAGAFSAALVDPGRASPRPSRRSFTGARGEPAPTGRTAGLLALTLFGGLALGAAVGRLSDGGRGTPAVYDVGLPDSAPIAYTAGSPWGEGWTALDVSPAGDFVVYVALRGEGTELWYRSLTDTVARPIAGTRGAYHPMLSPDGMSVAYFAGSRLMVVPVGGGSPSPIAGVDRPFGGQWATPTQLMVADSNGAVVMSFDPVGRSSRVVSGPHVNRCALPRLLTDGELACSHGTVHRLGVIVDSTARSFLQGGEAGSAERTPLAGSHFTPLAEGTLVFLSRDGSLVGASVDPVTLTTGRPVPLVGGVRREGFQAPGQFALSRSGTLVYAPGQNAEIGHFARIREGHPPEDLAIGPGAYHRFDLSPDGRRLVAMQVGLAGHELWVYDVARGRGERLLTTAEVGEPRWSPDGKQVAVMLMPGGGRPNATVLVTPGSAGLPDTVLVGADALNVFDFPADRELFGLSLRGVPVRVDPRATPPRVEPISQFARFASGLSPDRRWLAYSSGGTSGWETFVEPFPADGRRFKVSPAGGLEPLWRGNAELLYRSGSTWYAVRLDAGAADPVGEPRVIFSDPRFLDTFGRSNDVGPDGSVLYVRGTGETTGRFLRVIPDFSRRVRAQVAAASR